MTPRPAARKWTTTLVTLAALSVVAAACSVATAPTAQGPDSSPQATRQAVEDVVRLLGDATADTVGGTILAASGSFVACPLGGHRYQANVTLAGFHYGSDAAAAAAESRALRRALASAGYTAAGATPPGDDSDGSITVGKDGIRVSVDGAPASRVARGPVKALRNLDVETDCVAWKGADKAYVEKAELSSGLDDFADVVAEVAARARRH